MPLLCYHCAATTKQFPAHVLLSVMRVLHMFLDPVLCKQYHDSCHAASMHAQQTDDHELQEYEPSTWGKVIQDDKRAVKEGLGTSKWLEHLDCPPNPKLEKITHELARFEGSVVQDCHTARLKILKSEVSLCCLPFATV